MLPAVVRTMATTGTLSSNIALLSMTQRIRIRPGLRRRTELVVEFAAADCPPLVAILQAAAIDRFLHTRTDRPVSAATWRQAI